MRIAFLIEWDAYTSSGVLKKVEGQVRTWSAQGHEARAFMVTPRRDGPLVTDPAITTPVFFPFSFRRRQFINKVAGTRVVGRHLREFGPDIIYYRQSLWYPGLVGTLTRAAPYVLELNSLLAEEFAMRSPLISKFYALTEPWLLEGASGFVAVSGEIAEHYAHGAKPLAVVANGFPVTRCKPRRPPQNQRSQLIFVGTPGQAWHGLDKIALLASRFSEWDFHVVGPEASEIPGFGRPNMRAHGYLQQGRLAELYEQMDAGIGTLALHRKKMDEASPLKVREYVAYGLPVIAGYHDSDLSGCDFYLNIGNTEDNVQQGETAIRAFVKRWQGQAIDRAEVLARVDTGVKETRRLALMAKVVERHAV